MIEKDQVAFEAKLAELKATHGMVRVCETAAGTVVLRKPNSTEFAKFEAMAQSEDVNQNRAAFRMAVISIAVLPDAATMTQAFIDWPGLKLDAGLQQAWRELIGSVKSAEGKD